METIRKFFLMMTFSICSSYISYAQMTPSEMIKIYNMDLNKFKAYAISKGYKFDTEKSDEDTYYHKYRKGNGVNYKALCLYTKYFSYGSCIQYTTFNSDELIKFDKQLSILGFKQTSYEENKDKKSLSVRYKNDKFEVFIYAKETVSLIYLHQN